MIYWLTALASTALFCFTYGVRRERLRILRRLAIWRMSNMTRDYDPSLTENEKLGEIDKIINKILKVDS